MDVFVAVGVVVAVQIAGVFLILRKIEEAYARIAGVEWPAWNGYREPDCGTGAAAQVGEETRQVTARWLFLNPPALLLARAGLWLHRRQVDLVFNDAEAKRWGD